MNAFLDHVGRFCARRHWWVIAAWVIVVIVLALLRSNFGGDFSNNYTVPGSQSSQGIDLLKKEFPQQSGNAGQIVFHDTKAPVSSQSNAVNQSMANLSKLPHVLAASSPFAQNPSPFVSKDGSIAYGPISWNVVPQSLDTSYLHQMDAAVQPARSAGVQVEYGGAAGQVGQATHDLKSEIIGLACALALLLLMFGSIAAAAIPLLSAILSVLAGLSVVGLLAAAVTFPTTAPTVATLLGLGVAIDYGLFLVARHREQVDRGMDPVRSAGRATGTSGAAVSVAGSTVVVAILGLYVSGVPFVGAMGAASAIVVAIAMLVALTLTPAFMGAAKGSVRALRRPREAERVPIPAAAGGQESVAPIHEHAVHEHAVHEHAVHEQSAFARWGRKVSERPWPWAVASTLVLLILAIPLLSMRLGQLDAGTNPKTESSRRAYDLIAQGFGPGANGPLSVVVALPQQSAQDNQTALTTTQQTLASTPGVASVSAPSVNSAGTVAVLNVIPTTSPQDPSTTSLVNSLRMSVLPTVDTKTHASTYVVGTTAGYVDFTAQVSKRMPWLILTVVLLAWLLLTVAFRSVVIATKAGILNLLSVGAAYGVIVAVFQYGWGSGIVGIHETLPIPAFVPMLMFAIVFGLSMDYEVFLISRVHEAWTRTGDSHRAVAIGIGSTARVITTAAAIMVVVFASFVLDVDPTVKMLAVGMAVAVFIDASVIRMVLVPAVMALLGKAAWWMPRWLDVVTPHLDIEGASLSEGGATSGAPNVPTPAK